MTVETRQQTKLRFKKELIYIIEEVLYQDPGSDIHKALSKWPNVDALVCLTDTEIHGIQFKDDSNTLISLQNFEYSLIRLFRDFYHHARQKGRTFENIGDWEKLTYKEFNTFCTSLPSSFSDAPNPSKYSDKTHIEQGHTFNNIDDYKDIKRKQYDEFKAITPTELHSFPPIMPVENIHHQRPYSKVLSYILEEVLNQENGNDIHECLQQHGCKNVFDLVDLTATEIKALDFQDDEGNIFELGIYDMKKIHMFQAFYKHHVKQEGTFNTISEWEKLTYDDFF